MSDIEHRGPWQIAVCPNCGLRARDSSRTHSCSTPDNIAFPQVIEVVPLSQLEGAVEECELLREWIDAFGRESVSISVDDVLAASRQRVPPPKGGK